MNKHRLHTPGPTPIPPEVAAAMAQPLDYHRTDLFRAIVREVEENARYVIGTTADVAILASTGTGALECAVVNLFSQGDKVVAVQSGKFGERWVEIARAYGLEVVVIDLEWGQSVDPVVVKRTLNEHPDAKAVLSTLCETSTGALHDIRALGRIVRAKDRLLVTDAVSALGADELRMDEWLVDAVVSCSQKGLMTPPGIGLCALGERALEASKSSTLPKYYFDFEKYRANLEKETTPFTPAISLWYGLHAALKMMRDEGIDNVFARHARMGEASRSAAKALGLLLFPQHPANTLTSIRLPEGVDGRALLKRIRGEYGFVFAGGQDHLAGKIVRIAHLGWMDDFDMIASIAALERGLNDIGFHAPLGAGVAAAQSSLASPS
ncbi:MAG: alanine--glyoxylate aminotransferase family protein [Candidatus Poribacteria bacterium]|nr:alanine--glyoxylate aminotransferase family protein [Candidatus Poribacteria bacterium]